MLTDKLSVGANVYYSSLLIMMTEIEAGASVRYYPWGKTFFAGFGLGYHMTEETIGEGLSTGGAITPEIGWKIDVGNAGGFFVQPGLKLPITLGMRRGEFGVGFGAVAYCGLGWAF
jgi:hypothetical protein